jgi:hypothetical protein
MSVRFVTLAQGRRQRWVPFGQGWPSRKNGEPAGIRHAITIGQAAVGVHDHALCGAVTAGWQVFARVEFTGVALADCHRCAQLVHERRSRSQP